MLAKYTRSAVGNGYKQRYIFFSVSSKIYEFILWRHLNIKSLNSIALPYTSITKRLSHNNMKRNLEKWICGITLFSPSLKAYS